MTDVQGFTEGVVDLPPPSPTEQAMRILAGYVEDKIGEALFDVRETVGGLEARVQGHGEAIHQLIPAMEQLDMDVAVTRDELRLHRHVPELPDTERDDDVYREHIRSEAVRLRLMKPPTSSAPSPDAG